jgi:hypothetical protein
MFTHSLPLPTLETLACFGPTHIFKKKIYDTLGDVNPHIFRKKIYDTLGDALYAEEVGFSQILKD